VTYSTPPSECRAARQDLPASGGLLGERITTTWREEREAELRRRACGQMRIVFPRQPLRIVRDSPTLA